MALHFISQTQTRFFEVSNLPTHIRDPDAPAIALQPAVGVDDAEK